MTRDARTLLVAGTASHVGKSTVAAGLCRLLADRGVDVAPFKAQNMSNNARAVPTSSTASPNSTDSGGGFGEVGVSQYVQARAARVPPETDHNPVLLKPRGDGESQLVVNGEAVAHYAACDYYDDHWHDARDAAEAAHKRLAADHDVVVAEGAGSIAEINLHDRDLANVETARFGDAAILLVADIERGGVFASLVGTLELLPDDLRARVGGAVITKFRGDVSLLRDGLDAFEERTGVPVLGVLPYDDPGLPEEDSVALPAEGERAVHGADDGVPDERAVTVAVPRLPRISNATDTEPLAAMRGVRVAYVPLDDDLGGADAVVLPGTKNTVDDLIACREAGFDEAIRAFDGPVVGLCGGYQLLGERIRGADVESADANAPETVDGFGLLPVETTFDADKRVVATVLTVDPNPNGLLRTLGETSPGSRVEAVSVSGYEIHMGETRPAGHAGPSDGVEADRTDVALSTPFKPGRGGGDRSGVELGAATDRVLGTYLHGLFENEPVRSAFISEVRERAGVERPPERVGGDGTTPYDRAADLLRDHVDLAALDLRIGDEALDLPVGDGVEGCSHGADPDGPPDLDRNGI
ncbi:cobyric acid synthase [Halorubrum sp. DTA98]|uniref:cobyric acid synthase n=1 Tax=Halorubrum sp. DTA98 TaxID=3402163 RepID=UPI003AAA32B4